MVIYLRCRDVLEKGTITSKATGKNRTISCKQQIGNGYTWFVVDYTSTGGGWSSCAFSSIFYDRIIDLYDIT